MAWKVSENKGLVTMGKTTATRRVRFDLRAPARRLCT